MIMKKQYISPKAEVFVCKINSMLMASANLDSLTEPGSDMNIVPQEDELPDVVSEENVFNGRGLDW